jgi:hypothetical protein
MAQQPINVNATAESKSMNNSTDSSRKIEIGTVGGDFNASGSALNLGDISGTVTNTLQQLQTANHPNAPQLVDLLKRRSWEKPAKRNPTEKSQYRPRNLDQHLNPHSFPR